LHTKWNPILQFQSSHNQLTKNYAQKVENPIKLNCLEIFKNCVFYTEAREASGKSVSRYP